MKLAQLATATTGGTYSNRPPSTSSSPSLLSLQEQDAAGGDRTSDVDEMRFCFETNATSGSNYVQQLIWYKQHRPHVLWHDLQCLLSYLQRRFHAKQCEQVLKHWWTLKNHDGNNILHYIQECIQDEQLQRQVTHLLGA